MDYSPLKEENEIYPSILIETDRGTYAIHYENECAYLTRVKSTENPELFEEAKPLRFIALGKFEGNSIPALEQIYEALHSLSAFDLITQFFSDDNYAFELDKLFRANEGGIG